MSDTRTIDVKTVIQWLCPCGKTLETTYGVRRGDIVWCCHCGREIEVRSVAPLKAATK